MAVEGVPSSESRWISFKATSSPVCRFLPLKTYSASTLVRIHNFVVADI